MADEDKNTVSFRSKNIPKNISNNAVQNDVVHNNAVQNDLKSLDVVPFKKDVTPNKDTVQYRSKPETTLATVDNDIKGVLNAVNILTDVNSTTNQLLIDVKDAIAYTTQTDRLPYITGVSTIIVSTPTRPAAFDIITNGVTPGYQRERVFDTINTNADKIYVVNLGPGSLFVIYTSDGAVFSSAESFIDEGAVQIFYNVYEIRLRSPTLGCQYQLSQTEIPLQRTSVVKAEKIETYSTDSTVHFTGAIAYYAMQTTALTGLLGNKYFIRGVNIQSVQPLDFNLLFFGSMTFDTPGVLNTDTFLDSVELDMSEFPAFRINNINQYRLSVTSLDIMYECADLSNSLHMGLMNLSPIAKLAAAAGGVQIDNKNKI